PPSLPHRPRILRMRPSVTPCQVSAVINSVSAAMER
ncbi:uncharacterized protein METZ01_LOCUS200140, partial [marine metagenome]